VIQCLALVFILIQYSKLCFVRCILTRDWWRPTGIISTYRYYQLSTFM